MMKSLLIKVGMVTAMSIGILACSSSHAIETNPHIVVRAEATRIVQVSQNWLRGHGYDVVSSSEYRVKGSREITDPLSVVANGGRATQVIELIQYPRGDSTEIDLFAYRVGISSGNLGKQEVETNSAKLGDYQRQLDSLATSFARTRF